MRVVSRFLLLLLIPMVVSGLVYGDYILPRLGARTPAEFEPTEAVIMQWNYGQHDDLRRFLVENATQAGADVIVVVNDKANWEQIAEYLVSQGASLNNVRCVLARTDSHWVRDYFAANVYTHDGRAGLVDWKYSAAELLSFGPDIFDDLLPLTVAAALGRTLYRADSGLAKLVLDGGDFMTDGFGTAFFSEKVVDNNAHDVDRLESIMDAFMGIDRCVLLEKLIAGPKNHIDMYVKLLDEETILVGQYAEGVLGSEVIERNVEYLKSLVSCYGTPYRIIRIPMPEDNVLPDFRTYTNSLIVNNHVLVPVYGADRDEEALQIYRDAMPGYHIVGYDCSELIVDEGAIHCITNEIKPHRTTRIAHARFTEDILLNDEIVINAEIWSEESIRRVFAHVRMPDKEQPVRYIMKEKDGRYTARIPATVPGKVEYYISAISDGTVGYKPHNAYDGGFLAVNVATLEAQEKSYWESIAGSESYNGESSIEEDRGKQRRRRLAVIGEIEPFSSFRLSSVGIATCLSLQIGMITKVVLNRRGVGRT